MRQPVHHDLNGYRDLLLDFFSCAPDVIPIRDDLDVIVGYVRVGFDRQIVKRDRAPKSAAGSPPTGSGICYRARSQRGANHLDGLFMA
jgi:hypothetical protein